MTKKYTPASIAAAWGMNVDERDEVPDHELEDHDYQFMMPDGESFTIRVQQQPNRKWFAQAIDEGGTIIEESHDWFTQRKAVTETIATIITFQEN